VGDGDRRAVVVVFRAVLAIGTVPRPVVRDYYVTVRTTVDLPPAPHSRMQQLAAGRGLSMSAALRELVAERMAEFDEPSRVIIDELSGFPTIDSGRSVTPAEVAHLIDEDS
jgi:predicted transcriptional regulator